MCTLGLIVGSAVIVAPPGGARANSAESATPVSDRLRQVCTPDAKRLCPEHPLGSSQMRYCMESKRRSISRDCQIVLEDEGHVPRGYFASNRN